MMVKALCPDQMMPCMVNCIKMVMGEKGEFYISNMKKSLSSMIPHSSHKKPIMMMVSQGFTGSMI